MEAHHFCGYALDCEVLKEPRPSSPGSLRGRGAVGQDPQDGFGQRAGIVRGSQSRRSVSDGIAVDRQVGYDHRDLKGHGLEHGAWAALPSRRLHPHIGGAHQVGEVRPFPEDLGCLLQPVLLEEADQKRRLVAFSPSQQEAKRRIGLADLG